MLYAQQPTPTKKSGWIKIKLSSNELQDYDYGNWAGTCKKQGNNHPGK